MMDDEEIWQMDEFAHRFTATAFCLAMFVVGGIYAAWLYFFITRPPL